MKMIFKIFQNLKKQKYNKQFKEHNKDKLVNYIKEKINKVIIFNIIINSNNLRRNET